MLVKNSKPFNFHRKAAILILLLVVILSLPAMVGFIVEDNLSMQKLENRQMSACPQISLLQKSPGKFIDAFDKFLKDRVGFRRMANEAYRKLRYYLLKDPPLINITIGRDGNIFMNSHLIYRPYFVFDLLCEQQGDPKPQLLQEMDQIFSSVSHYYTSRGFNVTITAAPTTVAVYPDKLPLEVPKKYRDACLSYAKNDNLLFQLRRMGKENNRYTLYYPLELFKTHRDEPYFYPKESFHWSGQAAFLFARDLLLQSGVIDTLKIDDPKIIEKVGDDLTPYFGFSRDVKAYKFPYSNFQTTVDAPAWISSLCAQFGLLHYHTTNGLSKKRALLLSNSFGIELAPHLAKGFEDLYFFNLNVLMPEEQPKLFARIVDETKPDYIYILFDDAGIIAAPERLEAFLTLDKDSPQDERKIPVQSQ